MILPVSIQARNELDRRAATKELCKRDEQYFLSHCYHIVGKDRLDQTLTFNKVQADFETKRTGKDAILKARQEGVSTRILGRFMWLALFHDFRCGVGAHDAESTADLFSRIEYAWRSLPAWLKRKTRRETIKMLSFNDGPGLIRVFTAGSKDSGRGMVFDALHLSECSKYKNPGDVEAGVVQAMTPDGEIYRETTADPGWKPWWDACEDSGYKRHFYGWTWMYDKAFYEEKRKGFVASGSPYLIHQEYPATPEEAFVYGGIPRFDNERLSELAKYVKPPVDNGSVGQSFRLYESKGLLKIWESPDSRYSYVVGVDTAEGLAESDNTVIDVWCYDTWEQVAQVCGKLPEFVTAGLACDIAKWYNKATLAVEVENTGHAVMQKVLELNYNPIYRHKSYDSKGNARRKPGWSTNLKTKPDMLNRMAEAIAKGLPRFNSPDTISEFMAWQLEDGVPDTLKDDRAMAAMICVSLLAKGKFKYESMAV